MIVNVNKSNLLYIISDNIISKVITINRKIFKIILLSFIILVSVGIVSANDNINATDNIKDIIDNCDDETVNLEEKTYHLNPENETHIILNKSISIEGIEDKTVIDGNNTSLFLDVNESENNTTDENQPIISIYPDGYDFKYMGKNITFKNITFKNMKMTTWHEMKFINCKFINTTFTSYEYSNDFINSSLNKSKVEIVLYYGYESIYKDYSRIINCKIDDTLIKYKGVYTQYFIHIVGSDRYCITNTLNLINTRFNNSKIQLDECNFTAINSRFNNTSWTFHSSDLKLSDTVLNNSNITLTLSKMTVNSSNLTNIQSKFHAGYYNIGCQITVNNSILNHTAMEFKPTFGSRNSNLKILNSQINKNIIKTEENDVLISNSIFNQSQIELFVSDTIIEDSTFINHGNLTGTIKIRDYAEIIVYNESGASTMVKTKVPVKTNNTVENTYFVNETGKYKIKSDDINMDTSYKLTVVDQKSTYNLNDKLIIKLTYHDGKPIEGKEIFIENMKYYEYPNPVKTDSNGIVTYTLNKLGNQEIYVYYTVEGLKYFDTSYGISINLTVKPIPYDIQIKEINFKSNSFSKINSSLEIRTLINESSDLEGFKISCKIYSEDKTETYYLETDNKGITTFNIPTKLNAGKHKIEISLINTTIKKTLILEIAKAKTTVKAAKLTASHKKSKYFKVSVKNKDTKKAISKIKVNIKVYTGKKFKTYIVKTNKKGIAKINTKKLKIGKHKVIISSADDNYKISAKSLIKIKK